MRREWQCRRGRFWGSVGLGHLNSIDCILVMRRSAQLEFTHSLSSSPTLLPSQGIYRVPGNKPAIDALVQAFTEDAKNFQFTAKDVLHINSVASLLKQYLQALPEPVMTAKARPMFAAALGMEDGPAKEARFGELLQSLPAANRSTSLYLLAHMIKACGR